MTVKTRLAGMNRLDRPKEGHGDLALPNWDLERSHYGYRFNEMAVLALPEWPYIDHESAETGNS